MMTPTLDRVEVGAGVCLNADGTPGDDPRDSLVIWIEGREYTPAEALDIARTIETLVHDVT